MKNLELKEYNKVVCIDFIQKYHYSPVMPKLTKHYLGLFSNKNLAGVLTLGWGTQPLQTINKLFPGMVSKDYYEIGKMCIHPDMPPNTGSQFVSLVKKWMKQNTECKMLYTLADGIVGKIGYVYQASNFYYGGHFWTDVYISPDGEKMHPRSVKELLKENAKFVGKEKLFWLTPDFNKHKGIRRIRGKMFRYMLPLNKKSKRKIERSGNWNGAYPKANALQWKEQIAKGKYVLLDKMPEFCLDVVKVNAKNVNAHKKNNNYRSFFDVKMNFVKCAIF